MNRELPRILITSIPCWNDSVGSTTFSNLFEWYNSNKIANIYYREGVPSSKVCDTYFKISEPLIIQSILKRNIETGKIYLSKSCNGVGSQSDQFAFSKQRKQYKFFQRHRFYIFLLLREILWWLGKWKSKELNEYIGNFCPEIIIFPMESHFYFNRINRYIIRKTRAKAIGYFWDDNFSYKQDSGLFFFIHRFLLRKSLKETARLCSRVFAISPKMKQECDALFKLDSILLTKGIDIDHALKPTPISNHPLRMAYTGKLSIGRWKSLARIVSILNKINAEKIQIELYIYTTDTPQKQILQQLQGRGCHFCGAIPVKDVEIVQTESDILLFVESLDRKYKNMARLSFSTKLTDYFRCGKCIFAVGTPNIAPIEYLKDQKAAIIATSYNQIEEQIKHILQDKTIIFKYATNAYNCGRLNHNIKDIKSILETTILEVANHE